MTNAQQLRRNRKAKYQSDRMLIAILTTVTILAGGLMSILWSKDSPEYYRLQGGFFMVCVLVILASLTQIRIDKTLRESVSKLRGGYSTLSLLDRSNILWVGNSLLALIGLLVVDVSFFQHGGLRITAVLAIAFVNILWHLIRGK